ncbi:MULTISPECIES: 5-formyltetrahydrofolate cyclo-ligase [Listeria]|uniref:5-formyltetrahydrofolate cyclo-ligase n=1 Tax=Listeria TaxID=1637 RepID=UPI001FC8F092|nr:MULTISPECIES: 5-formyltetrahydrofolate cyclo-ligase [Listeria]
MPMNKNDLRQNVLQQLNQMNKEKHREKSEKLANQLFDTTEWQQAMIVGVTISRFPEVDTTCIIEKAFQERKTIVIPETIYPGNKMQFREYQSGDQLIEKKLGLKEPSEKATIVQKEKIDLLLVPGVVYNDVGYRIGFGGGFYDRYLENYPNQTISLCFSEQISSDLQPERHDIPVGKILVI